MKKSSRQADIEQRIGQIAAGMPAAEEELVELARAALVRYDRAVMARQESQADIAANEYRAVVWKLNGGTHFGCRADSQAPSNRLASLFAAKDGQVPMLGQHGLFEIEVDGIVAVVVASNTPEDWQKVNTFSLHAVSTGSPFISETGYRSLLLAVEDGLTVQEQVAAEIRHLLKEHGAVWIEEGYQRHIENSAWRKTRWGQDVIERRAAGGAFVGKAGQMGFVF